MATYTKETALYDTGAISADIADAGTKATNYLAADSSGIMVYDGSNGAQTPSSPSANTQNVFIDQDSLDIRRGTTVLATFGSDGAQIGKTSEGHINIESGEITFYDGSDEVCSFEAFVDGAYATSRLRGGNGRRLVVGTVTEGEPNGRSHIDAFDGYLQLHVNKSNSNNSASIWMQINPDSSSFISLNADAIGFYGYTLRDFVYESGTNGSWKYEKWESGKVEAWGMILFSTLTFSARGSLYRSVNNAFSIPSGIFAGAPTHGDAFIMGANMDYISATIGSLSDTGGSCEVWKATSGNGSNIYVHIHLVYIP